MTTPTRSTSGSDALSLTKTARQTSGAAVVNKMSASMPIADRYEIGHEVDSADAMTPGHIVPLPPVVPTTAAAGELTITQRTVPGLKDDHVIKLPSQQSRIGKPVWSAMERYPNASRRFISAWGNFLEFAPSVLTLGTFAYSTYSLAENWNKMSWQQRTLNTTATTATGVAGGTGLAAAIIKHMATAKVLAAQAPASTLDASKAFAHAAVLGKLAMGSVGVAGTIWTGMAVYNDFKDKSKNNIQRSISAGSAVMMTTGTILQFFPHAKLWCYGFMAASVLTTLVGKWLDRFVFDKKKKTKKQMVFGVLATATEGTAFAADQSKGRAKHFAKPLDKLDKFLVKESGG
ncbi:MAG TPA: hypothetical protein V6D47_02105 [Oscillatoriaceae cyanobacterium]